MAIPTMLGASAIKGLKFLLSGVSITLTEIGVLVVGCIVPLRDAFIRAYKTAYRSVMRPVEGTILTVAREGIENIKSQIGRNVLVPNLFSMYLAEMRKTLAHTPEMLPVLKDANVVDSGGYGYIILIEGMEKCLYGEEITAQKPSELQVKRATTTAFNENSAVKRNNLAVYTFCAHIYYMRLSYL